MRVGDKLTNDYIKKSWLNSEIWFFSCMHCSGLRGLQVALIMQHRPLSVAISLYSLSGINLLFMSSWHIQCSNCCYGSMTNLLHKYLMLIMSISALPIELPAKLTDECCMDCSSGSKGKLSDLHSFVESDEFNKQASIWGLCLRQVQSLVWRPIFTPLQTTGMQPKKKKATLRSFWLFKMGPIWRDLRSL